MRKLIIYGCVNTRDYEGDTAKENFKMWLSNHKSKIDVIKNIIKENKFEIKKIERESGSDLVFIIDFKFDTFYVPNGEKKLQEAINNIALDVQNLFRKKDVFENFIEYSFLVSIL